MGDRPHRRADLIMSAKSVKIQKSRSLREKEKADMDKFTDKIYLADSLITINRVIGDVYDGYFIDEGLLTSDENDALGAELEKISTRIEDKLNTPYVRQVICPNEELKKALRSMLED